MKHDKSSRAIQTHLEDQTAGERPDEQLAFDPTTGELSLVPRGKPSPDAIVVDSITEDGFFANPPLVFASEEQLRRLPAGEAQPGMAYAFDGDTVYHVHLGQPPSRPIGVPVPCGAVRLSSGSVADQLHEVTRHVQSGSPGQPVLAVAAAIGTSSCEIRAIRVEDGKLTVCNASCIPPKSELYSRLRGLLETDVLATKKVGIVGVGSGGAPIAVELAKAGVGTFVLIDPDRLELANVVRHVCGVSDLGRYKTRAVRDAILDKNPYAQVSVHELDINEELDACAALLDGVDVLIAATDGARSRYNLNQLAVELGIPALFGRALTRAAGGEVLRVRPGRGPCLACVSTDGMFRANEEISNRAQAARSVPAYVREGDLAATIQPGLSADIAPISNMMVRLALLELSGPGTVTDSQREDLLANFYIWANRRELSYAGWEPMGYGFRRVSILRWYGARLQRKGDCPVCRAPMPAVGTAFLNP